jgi:hypothetical protein
VVLVVQLLVTVGAARGSDRLSCPRDLSNSILRGPVAKASVGNPLRQPSAIGFVPLAGAAAKEGDTMAEQPSLWDYLESGSSQEYFEKADKERARRQAVQRLRSSGHWQTLLRVAGTLPQPFTLNDISVAVWKACPEFFGMRGYPYPDNHKVHYILYGNRGLIAKGMIRRVRQGLFQIPDNVAGTDPLDQPCPGEP